MASRLECGWDVDGTHRSASSSPTPRRSRMPVRVARAVPGS
ncbi:hypothetical protein ACWCQ1_46555 [Streptomyces sp. NPDC002144]